MEQRFRVRSNPAFERTAEYNTDIGRSTRQGQRTDVASTREEFVTQTESIYDSPRLAAGYAYDRPRIHQHIMQAAGEYLHITNRLGRALDIGCGAGLSTVALKRLSQ